MNSNDYSEINMAKAEKNHKEYLKRLKFYKEIGIDNEQEREIIGKLIDFHPNTILEIGTGKGYLTTYLAKKYRTVTTIDIDEESQHIAKLNALYANVHHKINFIIADGANLPLDDNSFDLVISAFAFHHIENPLTVFNEMIRVSKKYLIISEFNENGFEIIRKAHKMENRTHEEKNTNLPAFIEKIDSPILSIKAYSSQNQYIYTIKKRSI